MKHNVSLLIVMTLVCFPALVNSQNILTSSLNAPRDSDIIYKCRVKYTKPGDAGKDNCWNFSNASILEKSYSITYSRDTMLDIVGMEHNSMYKYRVSKDSLVQTGYEEPTTIIRYDHPILQQVYPFSMDMKSSSRYEGEGWYCGDHAMKITGNVEQEADGMGTIILSENDTLKNVLRVHTIRTSATTMTEDTCIADSADGHQEIEEAYRWYARGYRYPVYETVSRTSYYNLDPVACSQMAFLYLPEDQRILADSLNQVIATRDSAESRNDNNNGNNKPDIIKYTVQNSGSSITINYDLTESAHITALICNASGILYRHSERSDTAGEGYTLQIDCSGLRSGQYVLYINVNGKIYNEKINIQ